MKLAYYVEDGREQLVFTPETDIEKRMLALLDSDRDIKIYRGSFYECRGGWVRHKIAYRDQYSGEMIDDDESRIIVLDAKKPADVK